ncbi:TonB-dependent receptor domain-containing protein [Sphingopyxis sp.]|jgi:iron complex outermembrane receptor protein|uniref:TonB-dependent receptor domain-containing protein n=1 Tax=Sphingopyxis sp. TaxID=1908224 RepID=UPI002DE219A5|nr:TonB-dependent receptor [Sphingopyxis sp.]
MSNVEAADRDPRMIKLIARLMGGIAVGSMALHGVAAHAQAPAPAEEVVASTAAETGQDEGEIVVTGTQLRGIAPVGTNVVSMSREDIAATGATSANDILRAIPQVSSAFLSNPSAPPGGLSIIRPNIRNLGASGTNTTLVIVDGHRVVGAGVLQSTPDPDIIPPGVLERVDVVPDGGSSIYGSDAIGGVINYISRKTFDGFEVNARTGFADNYRTTDLSLTAGKDWGSGSAFVSYAWAHNDAIFGKDRDYVQQVTPNQGHCGAGTIFANGTSYAITGPDPDTFTPGTISSCDVTDEVSLWPEVTRHNMFAGITQEITSAITLDVRGYYADRRLTNHKGLDVDFGANTVTITAANPYFDPIAGETSQTVRTSYIGVFDDRYRNRLTSYGITPTVTAKLGGDWQLRTMFNYGRSITRTSETQVNAAIAANTLNYYNLASSTAAQLAAASLHNFGVGKQSLVNVRAIVDGPAFTLPGGEVRIAIGGEYYKEKVAVQGPSGAVAFGTEDSSPITRRDRDVKAVFAEIAVPLVGAENAMAGIEALTLSASGRYDDYSDQGGTFNPKLGLTYKPVDWIKIRGNWGKSFNAPALIDVTDVTFVFPIPFPAVVGQVSSATLIPTGNRGSDVKPQTATTWSVGFDISPPPLSGLTLSATYWNVDLKKEISLLAGQPLTPSLLASGLYQDPVPCVDAINRFSSAAPISTVLSTLAGLGVPAADRPAAACAALLNVSGATNIAVLDWRVQNLGEVKVEGIDFNASFNRPVSFGSVNASLAGSYTLNRDRAVVPGAPFVNALQNPGSSRLALIATAGVQVGNFTGSASLNHRSGYDIFPVIAANPANPFPQSQDHVGSFTTVDAFFQYRLPESWLKPETFLTLNVTNVFDQDPPFYNFPSFGGNSGYTNGSTLGRLVQIGIRSKF